MHGTPNFCLSYVSAAPSDGWGWALWSWEALRAAHVIPTVTRSCPELIWGLEGGRKGPSRRQSQSGEKMLGRECSGLRAQLTDSAPDQGNVAEGSLSG